MSLVQTDLEILTDAAFETRFPDVRHGFFTRKGGVSPGVYESLNCGPGSGDTGGNVTRNRESVARSFGREGADLVTLHQIHSHICHTIDGPLSNGPDRPQGDAMVTDVAGVILGVLTADCAPVLLAGRKADTSPVIGAAHVGWGGALKGVLGQTVLKMRECGAIETTITAVIGPCIHQRSYEVDTDFAQRFTDKDPEIQRFFMPARTPDKFLFDLPGYNASCLSEAGVSKAVIMPHDTYRDEARFFSYRRTTHAGEYDYGRQISAIMIRDFGKKGLISGADFL